MSTHRAILFPTPALLDELEASAKSGRAALEELREAFNHHDTAAYAVECATWMVTRGGRGVPPARPPQLPLPLAKAIRDEITERLFVDRRQGAVA